MEKIRIAVTGGAGAIGYSLLFRIASGEVFGSNTLIELSILDIKSMQKALFGVKLELLDCAYPLLESVFITDSPDAAFEEADYVVLVGAKPRSKGMERADLLKENAKIFHEQGQALNRAKNAKILVVGNPCNTNALIVKRAAKDIDPFQIRAMSRLDQNRAVSMVACRARVLNSDVENLVIFGNHSTSMAIHYLDATVEKEPILAAIPDEEWLKGEMTRSVKNRGAEILDARGLSSAASAANAVVDTLRDWDSDKITSAGVYSAGNPYGVEGDLYFSFPIQQGKIVENFTIDPFMEEQLRLSEEELIDERNTL
ncbi:malate dehydrogenase [bacterium]|nr:malate dehydrogenase [bacterium]